MGGTSGSERAVEPVAWSWLLVGGATASALLLSVASRYGYHRDELYFLEAGDHLAWGYPDQPPYVALVARAANAVADGSLVALRAPSAIITGLLVVVSGLVAREIGAARAGQALAAAVIATGAMVLGAGHLLSTTPAALLAWALVILLVLRALRTGAGSSWVMAGGVAGVGLQANSNLVFLLGAVLVGLLLGGPRRPLATPWPWVGAACALLLWSPYLVWQARNGWPQLEVSASIAAGDSGTSEPRSAFLPYQLVLLNPFMAPVWLVGQIRLFRSPALAWCRGLAWTWPLLAAVFLLSGGKPYYLGGVYPLLVGAGAQPAVEWAMAARVRTAVLLAGLALGLPAIGAALPILPVSRFADSPVAGANYDLGEQIGWPTFVDQVAAVVDEQNGSVALLTSNYGEAGALDRYGGPYGLPEAHSPDMGYWHWGPPPDSAHTVIAVGFTRDELATAFAEVELAARIDNGLGVENDEQGAPVWVCGGQRAPWRQLWDGFRRL